MNEKLGTGCWFSFLLALSLASGKIGIILTFHKIVLWKYLKRRCSWGMLFIYYNWFWFKGRYYRWKEWLHYWSWPNHYVQKTCRCSWCHECSWGISHRMNRQLALRSWDPYLVCEGRTSLGPPIMPVSWPTEILQCPEARSEKNLYGSISWQKSSRKTCEKKREYNILKYEICPAVF